MDCYHFCQQYEDYFETSGATGMNHTFFAITFFRGPISPRWAQHKRRHERATLIMWSEFKAFLRKDLGSSQAFINSIWSKFRRDSQYQLEEAQDWVSRLQHLQSILSEFDQTSDELTIICYFRKGLKPSIKGKMEQQDRESTNFEEIMQRAVNAEAKAGLRSSTMVWELDACCPRGYRPSHNTFFRCRPKSSATRTHHTPKNLSPRIRSQPRHVTMRRSRLRRRTGRKRGKGSGTRSRSTLVSKPRLLESTPKL